ncbi:MAG TPA: DUF1385 domain-containing protein [Actinomycetes bacterium]|jgi:uncharacterized protein YqhQ|nr:DUF1385 domain-containing protein [Actinomycetes bacterium]
MAGEPEGQPVHYGGQAVLEGVMMRGQDGWSLAVRRPQGEIYLERHRLTPLARRVRLFRLPFLRGVGVLADSLAIGVRALAISGNQALGEDERLSDRQMGWSLGIGAAFFTLLFILAPAAGTSWLSRHLPNNLLFNLVEGLVRLGFFLGYIVLISQLRDIRRVFQYHGAEHKTIHCQEAGLPLEPGNVDRFPTLHVRCGTNFLLILFVVTLVLFTAGFSLVGRPPLLVRVPIQLLAVPVIVGIAYEGIRLGAGRERSPLVRAIMQPGLWLQMLTTKPPSRDQIEVAIRSLEQVLPAADRARVAPLPSPVIAGPGAAEEDLATGG